jgi:hypothetical protein
MRRAPPWLHGAGGIHHTAHKFVWTSRHLAAWTSIMFGVTVGCSHGCGARRSSDSMQYRWT